ncbi:MAG: hypothetical protein LQ341_005213 [Variospora aurantia]|nr:MAG: hypothetical protein LQ341_005213 [Variospora aurantia]
MTQTAMADLDHVILNMPEHEDPAAVQATPPKQPSSNGKLSEDQKNALNIHNQARNDADKISGHPRGDLVWEDKLADNATAYVWHLAAANQGLKHSDGKKRPGQGENLAWRKQA